MVALLRQSLAEGGVGFSTTVSISHSDHNGDPVPSRWASDEELLALSAALAGFSRHLAGTGAVRGRAIWRAPIQAFDGHVSRGTAAR